MEKDSDRGLIDSHATGDSDNDALTQPTASTLSLSCHTVERRDIWRCLIMHVGLIFVHLVLLVIALRRWESHISVQLGSASAKLQTGLTIGGSAFGTAYTTLLVMYTQRLALRRDLLRPQSLTSLHDRTAAWLGVGSALNVIRKQSKTLGRHLVIAMYLLCVLGLHNTIPALLSLVTKSEFYTKEGIIVEMTPPSQFSFNGEPIKALLPALGVLDTPGLNSPSIHDIFNTTAAVRNGTNATVCVTTFSPTCELVPSTKINAGNLSSIDDMAEWNMEFVDRRIVSMTNTQNSAGRLLIVPPAVSRSGGGSYTSPIVSDFSTVMLLAGWNITDGNTGKTDSTIHLTINQSGNEPIETYLSFLNCTLLWDVRTAWIDSSNNIYQTNTTPASATCDREDINKTTTHGEIDPVHFNWTSIWPQLLGDYQVGRINGPVDFDGNDNSGSSTTYLQAMLGLKPNAVQVSYPTIQDISSGLANLTAAMFWLNAYASISVTFSYRHEDVPTTGWPLAYTINVSEPQIMDHLNINRAPLIVGLALSTIMTVLVLFLFQGKEPAIKGINSAGILQVAWLIARSPDGPMTLTEVDVPLEKDLRRAGEEIMWRGAADAWDASM